MLSEQDVDRELKAALSVSPSPGFEARVLQRVEADRPSRWPAHYGWLAAAASVVVAAGVFYAMNRPSVVVAPKAAPQIVEQTPPAIVAPPETTVRPSASAPTRVGTVRVARTPAPTATRPVAPTAPRIVAARTAPRIVAARTAPRTTEPVVIVSLNQMEAVRRLVRAVNEGRIEVPAEPPTGPMAPPAQLGVAPVVVQSIPLSPLGTGGTQK